jgi:elongator complex protein 6
MVNADSAFLQEPRTRLEIDHAAFVISLSHSAAWTVGLRLLDTGIAKDVSGVIRVTRGVGDTSAEEKEVLYYVGDGTVDVFDRGQVRE